MSPSVLHGTGCGTNFAIVKAEMGVMAMFEQQLGRSVTIDQAAELLQVSRRTVYNRIRDGKLLTIRTIGGSQRVLLSSVEDNRKFVWGVRTGAVHPSQTNLPQSEAFAVRNK
jgi:excisionase family DNA binding protein